MCFIETEYDVCLFFTTGGAYRLAEPTALHFSLCPLHHRGRRHKGQWDWKKYGTWCFILSAEPGGRPNQPAEPWVEVWYDSVTYVNTHMFYVWSLWYVHYTPWVMCTCVCSSAEQLVLYMKCAELLSSALHTAMAGIKEGKLYPSGSVKHGKSKKVRKL